jgi:hypothetical protein
MPSPWPEGWRHRIITVEDAEREHPGAEERPEPFGFLADDWKDLKAQMREGDELHAFSSEAASWEHLAGRAGVALVRDGEIVVSILTAMN